VVDRGSLSGLTLESAEPALAIVPDGTPSEFRVSNARFQNNPPDSVLPTIRGGAIRVTGTLVVEDSVFTDNGTESGEGGAIYGYNSSITVRRSLFQGNLAEGGAAIYAGNETADRRRQALRRRAHRSTRLFADGRLPDPAER